MLNLSLTMKKILRLILSGSIILTFSVNGQSVNHWETVVYNNDLWKYFTGLSEPDPGWRLLSFSDDTWAQGQGGFGFGDNDDNTVIPVCTSVYIRRKFNVTDTGAIVSAILNMDYDDAFVAYLNDVEIARVGISGVHPAYNQTGNDHEATMYRGREPESVLIDKNKLDLCLIEGENILAVQVHNSSLASSDMSSNVFFSFGIINTSNDYGPVPSWFVPPVEFASSNLPIVVINTLPGQIIMDEPKITADMKIVHNGGTALNHVSDPGNIYSGKTGIEIRGRYSASLPQKPYGIETRDETGANLDTALLGMPSENDWILLANYNDKTFLRNFLAFELFRQMGHYAPRSRFCEVVVNNDYQGIYLLTEKIKVDKNRVDIAKLNPDENDGDDITGGYMFKNDYFTANDSWVSKYSPVNKPGAQVRFVYYDPEPDELTYQQKDYISGFVDAFENILYSPEFADRQTGYSAYIDVNSFADYFIIGEISRNVDAYKKSRFYYKDKDSKDGRIHSGPVWDYDWAWKNITENCIHFNKTDGSGWAYRINECSAFPVPPSWEVKFLQDSRFIREIHDKYFLLRKHILSCDNIYKIIDSVALLLDAAQERHYQKWKILGINVGTPESREQPATYSGEIQKFKEWIDTRLRWLDSNMPGRSSALLEGYKPICRIFPNPAGDNLYIESDTIISSVVLYNLSGVPVLEKSNCNDYSATLRLGQLNQGLYITRISFRFGGMITRRLVKK
ncbi:MAG: CotH kinase family protein [Bacteroidales bacterium]|nr:CotH kinase family protein [Bacteroidales bacterium]